MRTLNVIFVMTLLLTPAHAQQATYRDAGGRTVGTASTDSGGQTTYRDADGRTVGTASTDSQGNATFRDAGGRIVGTSTRGGRR